MFPNLAYIIRQFVYFFAEVPGFGWGAEPSIWINRREVPRNALVDLIQCCQKVIHVTFKYAGGLLERTNTNAILIPSLPLLYLHKSNVGELGVDALVGFHGCSSSFSYEVELSQ